MRQKVYRRAKIGKGSAEAFLLPKKSYPRGSFVRGAGNDGRIAAGSCGPGRWRDSPYPFSSSSLSG